MMVLIKINCAFYLKSIALFLLLLAAPSAQQYVYHPAPIPTYQYINPYLHHYLDPYGFNSAPPTTYIARSPPPTFMFASSAPQPAPPSATTFAAPSSPPQTTFIYHPGRYYAIAPSQYIVG